jgi:hypothetical protein
MVPPGDSRCCLELCGAAARPAGSYEIALRPARPKCSQSAASIGPSSRLARFIALAVGA